MKKLINKHFLLVGFFLTLTKVVSAQSETKIKEDSLPVIIQNQLHKNYSSYKINYIYKKLDKQQNITYRVEVQKKTTQVEFLFDNLGKLIKKEKRKVYTYDGTEKSNSLSSPSNSNDGHNH